ncbi:urease accessory protein UreF [Rhizobiaceae bacterium]|nr:urease accessory protein UreF [Rhizobiaceae bacterium]
MADPTALLRLMTLLSPAFPTGGFAWSGGLEAAIRAGQVSNGHDLAERLRASLAFGPLRTEAILVAAAYRGDADANDMALALAGSASRYAETTGQGGAFVEAARPWLDRSGTDAGQPDTVALSTAIGITARHLGIPRADTVLAALQSAMSAQVQAALRLMPLGQEKATALLRSLEADILAAAKATVDATLDELGTATPMMEFAAMSHDTLDGRMFRS